MSFAKAILEHQRKNQSPYKFFKSTEIKQGMQRKDYMSFEVKDGTYWKPCPFIDLIDPSWLNKPGKYRITIEFTPNEE